MSKRNADYSAEVVEFNSNPGSLLLLAWNKSTFNMSPATGAEITHIDNAGFDINIFFRSRSDASQLSKRYDFGIEERKLADKNGVKSVISDLITSTSYATLPPGFPKYVAMFLWAVVLFLLFEIDVLPWLEKHNHQLAKHLPTILDTLRPYAPIGLAFLVGTHTLEAIYVVYILRPIVKSYKVLLSWVVYIFLYGFAVTERALLVHKASQKQKQ